MNKWTDETIEKAVRDLMHQLNINRMPTNTEMKGNKMSGLGRAIQLSGGVYVWSKKLGVPMKQKVTRWNEEAIRSETLKCIKILQIKRMPSASELTSIGRNDLHCAISKSGKKYSGWAKELGLEMKSSETTVGNQYEMYIKEYIENLGFDVKKMTTKHPYDLLVNDTLKIDTKVGKAHNHFGSRCHTFRPSKKYATCDLYICVALDESEDIEKYFVIPSKFAQLVTLNICKNSKYNSFIDRWDYIKRFVEFYDTIQEVSS